MNWKTKTYDNKIFKTSFIDEIEWVEEHQFEIEGNKQVIRFIKFFEEKFKVENDGYLYKLVVQGEEIKILCRMLKKKYPVPLDNEILNTMGRRDLGCFVFNEKKSVYNLIKKIKELFN